jgi:hypothetical protein
VQQIHPRKSKSCRRPKSPKANFATEPLSSIEDDDDFAEYERGLYEGARTAGVKLIMLLIDPPPWLALQKIPEWRAEELLDYIAGAICVSDSLKEPTPDGLSDAIGW